MNYKQVVSYFGGLSKAACALGIKRQNVNNWKQRGRIPSRWQMRVESLSEGKLRADAQAHRDVVEMASFLAHRAKT